MNKPQSEQKRQRDHERYLRHREERLAKQRAYYWANRERILQWHRDRLERERRRLFGGFD